MNRIKIEAEKCAGCRYCEMVCSFRHKKVFSPSYARIRVYKEDKFGFDYPVLCHQCEECPPINGCLNGALSKTDLGYIQVNRNACEGCGACASKCTFNAVFLDQSSRPLICDLCEGETECVKRCPTQALTLLAKLEDFEKTNFVFKKMMKKWGIDD